MTGKGKLHELDIRVVVLVGGRDFGRCPLAAHRPAALWPIADRPALLGLLDHLAGTGLDQVTICCARDIATEVEVICGAGRMEVRIVTEELISGTGGCLREAAGSDPGDLIMVFSGSMAAPPAIPDLVEGHLAGGADLTVVFNPDCPETGLPGSPAEIFLCRPSVLGYVPSGGYADIKEGVIPAILRAGGTVRPLVLDREVGNFRDREEYLDAIETFFEWSASDRLGPASGQRLEEDSVLKGTDVFVHPYARVCGPVLIGDRTKIQEGAVVIGPAIIGQNVVVGENSAAVRSALWAGAVVGRDCEIRESILECQAIVPDGAEVVERTVSPAVSTSVDEVGRGAWIRASSSGIGTSVSSRLHHWVQWGTGRTGLPPQSTAAILGGGVVFIALFWSYWPTIADLMHVWKRSDEYSSGLLVPFLAAYVIWSRREEIGSAEFRPVLLWGVGALLAAQAVRGLALYYMFQSAERLSLVLSIWALVLLMTGWRYLVKLAPVLIFLLLMLPWPNRMQTAVMLPLQQWATGSAVFCLELMGWEIVREGNIIHIGDASVAVAEACNGLRMVTAFFVISGLVVLLARRAWWEKLIVLASSLPIALLCNTVRLAITAMFFTILEGEEWEQRFHDWGGYAMMPLALAMMVGELWLLTQLTTPPVEIEPAIISRRQPQHIPDP